MKSPIKVNGKAPFMERFWLRVKRPIKPDACWLWQGAITSKGYGNLMLHGRTIGAHIVALELKLGRRLRPGHQALHRCGNRACVRPGHIYEGTAWDNAQDRLRDANERGGGK